MLDPALIETRYARSGTLNIAYQVFGEGELRIVHIPGWASNVENIWTIPEFVEFQTKLAAFARVILLDRRGTGLSPSRRVASARGRASALRFNAQSPPPWFPESRPP